MLKEYLSTLANKFRIILGTTEPINAQDFEGKIVSVFAEGHQTGEIAGHQAGLAEGIEQGKTLGKIELLTDSKYMNAKVNGTAIAANDVSPIEHSVGCKLTSDTITDFSTVEVSRYGKNLFDKDNTYYGKGKFWLTTSGILVNNNDYYASPKIPINSNVQYIRTDVGTSANLYFDKDGNFISVDYGKTTIKPPSNAYYVAFNIANAINPDTIQVELGNTATAYESYIQPITYTAKADGTVEGVTSISPNMTLLTNNNNVVINANYLRDIDTYIDNLKTNVALTGGK